MKKTVIFLLIGVMASPAFAAGYIGLGIGLSEACRTQYQPSFAGGDCINANVDIHGLTGYQLNDYFSVEASLDVSFYAGHAINAVLSNDDEESFFVGSEVHNDRWSVSTLGLHAFAQLPVTRSVSLFAGPSLGGSMTSFDYDVKYFGNGDEDSQSATEFGLNYGWAVGIDFFSGDKSRTRVQWQNWRSLDADVAANGEFNSNTLTISFVSFF
jgi:hypothetical protein